MSKQSKAEPKTETVLVKRNPLFRMPYEDIEHIFFALMGGFYPDGIPEDGPDDRVQAVWVHALTVANWTLDEFWEEMDRQEEHSCPECEAEAAKEADGKKDTQSN